MPRVLGVDIPGEKRIEASLAYLYGVGPKISREILEKADIDLNIRAKDLDEEQISKIASAIQFIILPGAGWHRMTITRQNTTALHVCNVKD